MNRLIVFCENFGTSFSGGSTATARFVRHLVDSFSDIKVLCQNHDGYLGNEVELIRYNPEDSVSALLIKEADSRTIGYGDFYIAKAFIGTGIPFYFHYHDNWPEMSDFSSNDLGKSRIEDYGNIFENAEHTFSVSHAKLPFIQQYTDNVSVIRNGLSQPVTKIKPLDIQEGTFRILMAGNFNVRKYEKAVELFQRIQEKGIRDIEIDVFGNDEDKHISDQLSSFSFVNKRSFQKTISFDAYHLYLNTSLMENLSLSVVDAIANCTPVVSFDVGGTKEVVNSKNGAIIDRYTIEDMLEAILQIKEGEVTHEFDPAVLSDFNWEIGAKKMFSIMNKTVSAS